MNNTTNSPARVCVQGDFLYINKNKYYKNRLLRPGDILCNLSWYLFSNPHLFLDREKNIDSNGNIKIKYKVISIDECITLKNLNDLSDVFSIVHIPSEYRVLVQE